MVSNDRYGMLIIFAALLLLSSQEPDASSGTMEVPGALILARKRMFKMQSHGKAVLGVLAFWRLTVDGCGFGHTRMP